MNNNKTNTHVLCNDGVKRVLCNDGVKRVLYEGDNGSFFVKMKGNDGHMMFVLYTKPNSVKNQNGGKVRKIWKVARFFVKPAISATVAITT